MAEANRDIAEITRWTHVTIVEYFQLASSSVTHQSHGQNNSECCSINKILHIPGSIGSSPVTFLLDSGAAISVIRLDTLDTHVRNQITDAGLMAPIGANSSPLDVIGQITLPVNIGNFQSDQVFIVMRTLTVDCLLGADYLVAHEVVINYKQAIVEIKGHNIPFTLTNSVATIRQHMPCNQTISALHTMTIPGHSVQLIDVTLPDNAKSMDLPSVLIEPHTAAKIPKHVVMARTCSPVCNGHLAVNQVMHISPTPLTIYQGTKLGEYTPLAELLLIDTPHSRHPPAPTSALPDVDLSQCKLCLLINNRNY